MTSAARGDDPLGVRSPDAPAFQSRRGGWPLGVPAPPRSGSPWKKEERARVRAAVARPPSPRSLNPGAPWFLPGPSSREASSLAQPTGSCSEAGLGGWLWRRYRQLGRTEAGALCDKRGRAPARARAGPGARPGPLPGKVCDRRGGKSQVQPPNQRGSSGERPKDSVAPRALPAHPSARPSPHFDPAVTSHPRFLGLARTSG